MSHFLWKNHSCCDIFAVAVVAVAVDAAVLTGVVDAFAYVAVAVAVAVTISIVFLKHLYLVGAI